MVNGVWGGAQVIRPSFSKKVFLILGAGLREDLKNIKKTSTKFVHRCVRLNKVKNS